MRFALERKESERNKRQDAPRPWTFCSSSWESPQPHRQPQSPTCASAMHEYQNNAVRSLTLRGKEHQKEHDEPSSSPSWLLLPPAARQRPSRRPSSSRARRLPHHSRQPRACEPREHASWHRRSCERERAGNRGQPVSRRGAWFLLGVKLNSLGRVRAVLVERQPLLDLIPQNLAELCRGNVGEAVDTGRDRALVGEESRDLGAGETKIFEASARGNIPKWRHVKLASSFKSQQRTSRLGLKTHPTLVLGASTADEGGL